MIFAYPPSCPVHHCLHNATKAIRHQLHFDGAGCEQQDCVYLPRVVLQLLQDRQQWLAGCEELTGWVDRTTQSVLQLEKSREGFVWSRSAGADSQPFADYAASLQQRRQLMAARQAAQNEVGCVDNLHPCTFICVNTGQLILIL